MRLLMRAPWFRTLNLEGPRKVGLVFTISFLLKWALGWIIDPTVLLADMRVTDLFGFGYLLSSLIVVKILQKDTFSRIAVPTFVVSALTFVVGSAIGFGLDRLAPAPQPVPDVPPVPTTPTTTVLAQTPRGVLALGHVRARLDVAADLPLDPSDYQLGQYDDVWRSIAPWLASGSEKQRITAEGKLQALQIALRPIAKLGKRDAFGLFELEERLVAHVGWDTAVLVPGAPGPVIVVPYPVRESPTAEVAAELCERVDCRAVLISGVDAPGAKRAKTTAHQTARAAFSNVPMLELRIDDRLQPGRSVLHVANEKPDLNVAALWPRGLELSWQPMPGDRAGASVLYAKADDYWQIVIGVSSIALQRETAIEAWFAKFFERLPPRVRAIDPRAADAPSPQAPPDLAADITNQQPSQSELRFLQVLVARWALVSERGRTIANAMAGLVGYALTDLPEGLGTEGAWVLAEATRPRTLGWGVLAGRTNVLANPIAVEIPRPRREAGTWRLGVELWRHAGGMTLVVADGDVPDDRLDADPAATWNVMTGFQAFHQAVYETPRDPERAAPMHEPAILVIRGFGVTQPIRDAAVVTMPRPLLGPEQLPARIAALLAPEGALGFIKPVRLNDGAEELVDVTGTGNPQLHYCSKFEGVDCAMLWFSELVRDAYKEVDRDREMQKLERMKVPIVRASAAAALVEPELGAPDPAKVAAAKPRFTELVRIAEAYSIEQNVQLLRVLVNRAAEGNRVAVRGGFSDELGRPFLIVELHEGDLVLRGLVLIPSGSERIDLTAGSERAKHVPELLGRRPRLVTYAGRSAEVAPVEAPPRKKKRGR
jgi:gamma-polyglutamate biosynthesis protein CapC